MSCQCEDYMNGRVVCAECSKAASVSFSPEFTGYAAHKVMTAEEYITEPIVGWHMVCRDVDGFGNIGIRYTTPFTGKSDKF